MSIEGTHTTTAAACLRSVRELLRELLRELHDKSEAQLRWALRNWQMAGRLCEVCARNRNKWGTDGEMTPTHTADSLLISRWASAQDV